VLGLPLALADEIYQYQKADGTIVFTNKPVKNAKKVKLPPLSVYSSPMTKSDYQAAGYTAPMQHGQSNKLQSYANPLSTAGFNEVGRKQILSEELARERQALSDSQAALLEAKQNPLASEKNHPTEHANRLQALHDAITEHQKNIAILSQQLGINN
jgi:hypothetical protein